MAVTAGRRKGDAKNPTSVRPEVGFSIHVRLLQDQLDSTSAHTSVHRHHQPEAHACKASRSLICSMELLYGNLMPASRRDGSARRVRPTGRALELPCDRRSSVISSGPLSNIVAGRENLV